MIDRRVMLMMSTAALAAVQVAGLAEEPAAARLEKVPPLTPLQQAPFEGKGLFREKGGLNLPVQGRVIQPYGRQKVSDFEDMIFSKGVEYSTAADSPVVAISMGRVMHVGRMPGYGTIVILDHGERYYSLYGRLGAVSVEKGTVVEKGFPLAKTSQPDQKGRNFYFEIRRNGSPVNPQDYFKRL